MAKIRVSGKIGCENFVITAEQEGEDEFAEVKVECSNAKLLSAIKDDINTGKKDIEFVCLHNYGDKYIPFYPDPNGIDGIYEILVFYYGKNNVEVEGDPYFKEHDAEEKLMREQPGVVF